MSKLMVISADGHAAAPLADYRPYLESKYHSRFDEVLADASAQMTVDFFEVLDPGLASRYKASIYDSGAIDARHDPVLRLAVLAGDGVVGELLFPDGAPFGAGGLGPDRGSFTPELVLAGARAYNRWIVDFVEGHPGLGSQTIAVLDDIDEAVRDVYWAKDHGCKSIFMPGMDDDRPFYWDPMYEPFWSACEETGIPINFHGGTGQPTYGKADVPSEVMWRIVGMEFPYYAHRPLWFLIWSGVLERHPNLRVAFTEQHSDWVAEAVAKMDHSWHNGMFDDKIRETVPSPPSTYFERQVWLGASLLSRGELLTRNQIGPNKMMFGVDFPHPEGTLGLTREYLRATVASAGMLEPEIRAFLGGTAAEFYGFDVEALAPMAEEHGLELDEILVPLPLAEETSGIFRGLDPLRPTAAMTALR